MKWSIKKRNYSENLQVTECKNIDEQNNLNTLEEDYSQKNNHEKISLFKKNSTEDNYEADFEVKKHTEGTNELKSLQLKSKLTNNDHFNLNERFFENNEQQRNRLKDKFQDTDKFKEIFQNRSLIRYDPTKSDHRMLEKNSQKDVINKKKKKIKDKTEKRKKEEERREVIKPEVSKEKYYNVTNTLKDSFREKEEKSTFTLSSLFDEKLKEDKKLTNNDAYVVPIKKIRLEYQSVLEDNEKVTIDETPLDLPLTTPTEKVLDKCGVWGETFFFKANDSRFSEAVNFCENSDKSRNVDYEKKRSHLKSIVRKKLQNSKRTNKLFKKKLGGRISRKLRMRLKKIHS